MKTHLQISKEFLSSFNNQLNEIRAIQKKQHELMNVLSAKLIKAIADGCDDSNNNGVTTSFDKKEDTITGNTEAEKTTKCDIFERIFPLPAEGVLVDYPKPKVKFDLHEKMKSLGLFEQKKKIGNRLKQLNEYMQNKSVKDEHEPETEEPEVDITLLDLAKEMEKYVRIFSDDTESRNKEDVKRAIILKVIYYILGLTSEKAEDIILPHELLNRNFTSILNDIVIPSEMLKLLKKIKNTIYNATNCGFYKASKVIDTIRATKNMTQSTIVAEKEYKLFHTYFNFILKSIRPNGSNEISDSIKLIIEDRNEKEDDEYVITYRTDFYAILDNILKHIL